MKFILDIFLLKIVFNESESMMVKQPVTRMCSARAQTEDLKYAKPVFYLSTRSDKFFPFLLVMCVLSAKS